MNDKDNNHHIYKNAKDDLIQKFLEQENVTASYYKNIPLLQKIFGKQIFSNIQGKDTPLPEDKKEQHAKNTFEAYLETTLSHKTYNQHEEIHKKLEEIEEYRSAENKRGLCTLITDMLKNFKDVISFDTTVQLYFILIEHYIEDAMPKDALIILNSIQTYEKHLSKHYQQRLWFFLAKTYYLLGWQTKNKEHFTAALEYIIRPIDYRNFNKSECESMLMMEANIHWERKDYDLCLLVIQEYFSIFPNTDTDNDADTSVASALLCIQGTIYAEKNQYKQAITSFREYLKYHPDDEEIKTYIRNISEQKPE